MPDQDPLSPRAPRGPHDYAHRSQSDRLQDVQTALSALDGNADIAAAMAPRGYGPAGIATGQAFLDAVRTTGKTQTAAKGQRLNQTAGQDAAVDAAEALYRPLAATATTLFKKRPDDLAALGLTGEHGHSLPERLDRMRDFAQIAREPGRIEAFTQVGVPAKDFDALDAALDAAARLATAQDHGTGTAQDASATKKQAFAALDDWMGTMHGHARVVLAGRAQLLELLGIHPR